ncbi:MAG: hypothetical protein AB1700_18745, partial [Bacillota bacterium]
RAKRIVGFVALCLAVLSAPTCFAASVCDICGTTGGGLTQVHRPAIIDKVTIEATYTGDCGTSTATLSLLTPTKFMSYANATCSIGTFLTMQYSWKLQWYGPAGWTTVNSGSGQQSNINSDEWGKIVYPTFDGSSGQYMIKWTLTAWVLRFDGQTGSCVGYPYEYYTVSGPAPAPAD